MPPQLKKNEETASIQLKIPMSLKRKVSKMAKPEHDGNVSRWLRALIEESWQDFRKVKAKSAARA